MHNWFTVTDDMVLDEATEGSEEKFFIRVDGFKYLVKDSSYNKRRRQNSLAPFCEYTGSTFIRSLNIPCQETFLGFYHGKVVVICKDLFKDCDFKPFKDIHQSSVGTDLGDKLYTYSDVLYVIRRHKKLKNKQLFVGHFWKMFICDATLGNRDRHEGNWGFTCDREGVYRISPIFDNGASLFPDVNLSKIHEKDFVKERVYKIPASQFKMWRDEYKDRPMRTNYWEVLQSAERSSFFRKIKSEFLNIDICSKIALSTKDVFGDVRYWFSVIIYCRYNCLIMQRDFDIVYEEAMQLYDIR